jgi:hypothetical protein
MGELNLESQMELLKPYLDAYVLRLVWVSEMPELGYSFK